MRVVFLGTPECVVPVLQKLIQLDSEGSIELLGVISQPARPSGRGRKLLDPPVAKFAKEHGLQVMQPAKASDREFQQKLMSMKPDLCLTAAYGQILNEDFLNIPARATFNVHPSLLPAYRGATPVPATILAGDRDTGVSLLFTVRKVDAGALICQKKISLDPAIDAEELTEKLFCLGSELLPEAFSLLSDPKYVGEEQDEESVTHCGRIKKDDGLLNWSFEATELVRRYLAYQPWPGVFTYFKGKRVALKGVTETKTPFLSESLGEIEFDKEGRCLRVLCGTNGISVSDVKVEGSGWKSAQDFWNGLVDRKGARFESL